MFVSLLNVPDYGLTQNPPLLEYLEIICDLYAQRCAASPLPSASALIMLQIENTGKSSSTGQLMHFQ
jgi:hypothetical protein